MNTKKPILVFDLDNTLILRNKAMVLCIQSIFNIPLNPTQQQLIERQDKEGYANRMDFCQWLKNFFSIPLSVDTIWHSIKTNIGYFVNLNAHARQVLQQLQYQHELVLLTNGGTENQLRKIHQTGLNEFFPSNKIFISEALGCQKPNPTIFQIVQNQFPMHSAFYMIGDHWENDILGALQCGWKTIY